MSSTGPQHIVDDVDKQREDVPADAVSEGGSLLKIVNPVRRRVIAALIAGILLLAGTLYVAWDMGVITPKPIPVSDGTTALTTRGFLDLSVQADDWDLDYSTPAVVHVQSEDGNVDFYHAAKANTHELMEIESGSYLVSVLSPINEDGSYYYVPEPEPVTVERGHTGVCTINLEYVPANQGRWVEYQELLDNLAVAIEQGDETLQGEVGESLHEWATSNALASPFYALP